MDNSLNSINSGISAFQELSKQMPLTSERGKMAHTDEAAPKDSFKKASRKSEKSNDASGEKEYTILAYMDGSNNLEDCILEDLKEMENCPPPENYNLVTQFSRDHTNAFTVMFLAEALSQAFKSKDFKGALDQIVADPSLIDNYNEILKDQEVCQNISLILLKRNPELQEKLDKLVKTKVKETMGQNRALKDVINETAVEVLKGVFVNEAIQQMLQSEDEQEEELKMKSAAGSAQPPMTAMLSSGPSLTEILGDDFGNNTPKKPTSVISDIVRATADLIKSDHAGGSPVSMLSFADSGSTQVQTRPGGNIFFVESEGNKSLKFDHADYSELFADVDGVEVNKEPLWRGVRRYKVEHHENNGKINSPVLKDLGMTDMSSQKTFSDFLVWGMKKFPAKHYVVILSDHGAGFLGAQEDKGNLMSMPDIKAAFEKAAEKTGKKPDIIAFDTCLMGQLEVAKELKDSAKYLIASEETIGGDGYPYSEILPKIDEAISEGKTNPKEIAKIFIDEAENVNDESTVTLSAIDLTAIGKVVDAANELAKHILEGKANLEDVRDSIKQTQRFCVGMASNLPYDDFRDLWDLADKLEKNPNIKNREIKSDLKDIKKAVEEAVVFEEHNEDEDYEGAHGITIYAPRRQKNVEPEIMEKYDELSMSKRTKWNELIKKLTDFDEIDLEKNESGKPKITFIKLPERRR